MWRSQVQKTPATKPNHVLHGTCVRKIHSPPLHQGVRDEGTVSRGFLGSTVQLRQITAVVIKLCRISIGLHVVIYLRVPVEEALVYMDPTYLSWCEQFRRWVNVLVNTSHTHVLFEADALSFVVTDVLFGCNNLNDACGQGAGVVRQKRASWLVCAIR